MKYGGRHAKRLRLRFNASRDVEISLRSFRTKKQTRSTSKRWHVLPLLGLPYKEVALRVQRRRKKQYTLVLGFRIGSLALIILGMVGALYSSQHVMAYAELAPENTTQSSVPAPHAEDSSQEKESSLSSSPPKSLRIKTVDVSSEVVSTGLASDGTIEVPPPARAGWYKHGPTPGEVGPAVIVGHVDNYGQEGVFWRLHELSVGDTFDITRKDGTIVSFEVESVEQFAKDDFPTKKIYGAIDYAGIRLITCGGQYDPAIQTYDKNTVVFGKMVSYKN